jgi:hypothetical protein
MPCLGVVGVLLGGRVQEHEAKEHDPPLVRQGRWEAARFTPRLFWIAK